MKTERTIKGYDKGALESLALTIDETKMSIEAITGKPCDKTMLLDAMKRLYEKHRPTDDSARTDCFSPGRAMRSDDGGAPETRTFKKTI